MIVAYTLCPVRMAIPGLGGSLLVPRPILAVQITGPGGMVLRDGHLDTGSDETLLDSSVAGHIGVDLTAAPEREINLVGRGLIRCRYGQVEFRITDGIHETYQWSAIVAFSPFRLRRSLLGYAGFLQ